LSHSTACFFRMKQPLVLTLIGPDRPGLVETVARLVNEHQGNWLESRMARLGGQFAGIVRVQIPEENRDSLVQALNSLERESLQVTVRIDPSGDSGVAEGRQATIELVGQDRPGIIRHMAAELARHGVNVEELSSEIVSAPMSGETLFKASANLRIPASCSIEALREDLERIAHELMVDLKMSRRH
jgi:glycine cleavage system regulatory protein